MPLPDVPPAISLPLLATQFDTAVASGSREARASVRPRCDPGQAGEITVCASDPKRYRLSQLPVSPPEGLPKAEMQLDEAIAVDLHSEYAQISGTPSNRMMVGAKIKF
jgi:hypothetical protein